MEKAVAIVAKAQTPTALILVAVLAYDLVLRMQGTPEGLGMSSGMVELLAFVAAGLGIPRASEVAARLASNVKTEPK